jgi:hypothetical protein
MVLGIPLSQIYWCSYYNRYVCGDCISEQYSVIPVYIIKYWCFKKFPISKESMKVINKWFDKPVIHIKSNERIVRMSSQLKQAVIFKRKIHKIFDLMKCTNLDTFIEDTLGKYNYIILKENMFSLRDLYDIYEGKFIVKLKSFFKIFEDHILSCKVIFYLFRFVTIRVINV